MKVLFPLLAVIVVSTVVAAGVYFVLMLALHLT